jgi:Flp pilus assembly protein TadD
MMKASLPQPIGPHANRAAKVAVDSRASAQLLGRNQLAVSSSSLDIEAFQLFRAGRLDEALVTAAQAVAHASVCSPTHGVLATILVRLGRARDAESVVCRALELTTGIADAFDGLAYVSTALGRHERASTLYRRAAQLSPQTARFWYNLACSERSLGRLEEAEAACDRSIAAEAAQYPSYLLRSELRVQTPEFNHVEELRSRLAVEGSENRACMFLGYALAKELDDLQRFDEAFQWFSKAAGARRSRLAYDVAVDEQKMRRIAQVYPAESFARARHTTDSPRYIFIVGLPRSGTTLVERILTGLPGVSSNGETDNFSRALLAASGDTGDVFLRAAQAQAERVAANYAARASTGSPNGSIIEKLPMNYLYAGAIHRALPDAKILWVRRSALDSCFAMYRTLFGEAYPFTYDFEELARYFAAYDNLMIHWRAALGERLYEVVYENLVQAPERVGAAVASHCGLDWTPTAIDIAKNTAVSLTASAAQVRRPIYGTSSGRWRYYHRHLEPLVAALRRCGIDLPQDT